MAIINNILLTICNKSCIMYKNNISKERDTMNKLRISAVFAMLLAVLAINALAFSGGTGTEADPFLVSTSADLSELATESYEGKYFRQTADIEVASVSIGTNEVPFAGKYDGFDFAISGLTTDSGLFAYVNNAEIKNVNVKSATVTADALSAGIVGKATGTTVITNCSFAGTFVDAAANAFTSYVGGICAIAGEQTTITNCKADVTADLTKSPYMFYIGGIVGANNGSVLESESKGTISVVSDNYILGVGGIAGKNVGTIAGSKNLASVSGDITTGAAKLYLGGIAGENNGTVERAENKGAISCTGYEEYPVYAGGVVGYNVNGTVSESKNTGTIDASASYVGGVLGINMSNDGNATVSDTLNSGAVTSTNGVAGGIAGGNIAMEGENTSSISSSLNTHAMASGDAAVGDVSTGADATSEITDVVANGASEHASNMTADQLKTAQDIPALKSAAWLYPQNGLLPQLATVKNLSRVEVIALTLDKSANKVAFSVYNPGAQTSAQAIVSFYNGTRFIGSKFADDLTIPAGYKVFTVDSATVADATFASVMLLEDTSTLSPVADKSDF